MIIANEEIVTLPTRKFFINVTHLEDVSVVEEFKVSDNGLIIPRPQWDTTYTFDLNCGHRDLNFLDCGRFEVKAVITDTTEDCLANLPTCPIDQRVQFMQPQTLNAISMLNGSILITWQDSDMGWKTSKRRVKVLDQQTSRVVVNELSQENRNILLVPTPLEAGQSYNLVFAPEGPNIPDFVQEFSTVLILCKCPSLTITIFIYISFDNCKIQSNLYGNYFLMNT